MKLKIITFSLLLANGAVLANTSNESIEQITVTATATESPLLSVASNLAVINAEELGFIEHEHINQAFSRVAGGWISRGNGQEHLTAIRSPVLTGAGGCGAFVIAQDGISVRAPGFCNANQLFDVNSEQAARIEVLRGPSSTLFGTNAVHGVINIITPNPIDQATNSIGIGIGPHDYLNNHISVTRLMDDHAIMFFGNTSQDGGYKNDSGYEQQKATAIHQYRTHKLDVKSVIAVTNLNQETAGLVAGFEAYKDHSLRQVNPNPEAFRDSKSVRAYSKVDIQVDQNTNYSITPYVRWTDMAFLQHYLPWKPLEENDQLGLGLKTNMVKKFGDAQWHLGADIDLTAGDLTETQAADFSPTTPTGVHYNYTVDAKILALYSQLNWAWSSKGSLSAGVRLEQTKYNYKNHLSDGDICNVNVTKCRFTRPKDQNVTFAEPAYQLSSQYLLGDKHSIYSTYSIGYRAPQATELFRLQAGQQIADLEPEQISSFEIGLRGQYSDIYYDITAFTMQKDNFIFQDTNRQNISDGKTSHNGFELSLNYQLPYRLYLNANGTLANHKYNSTLNLSHNDIKGNEIDTAPQHMGSVQLGWNSDQGSRVELEWIHLGNYFLNPENTSEYEGHNLLNLRMNTDIHRNLTFSARILNLTNQNYAERADFSFNQYSYFIGEPRSLFFSLKYTF
ncbi:TonB-dependent receptor [Shewanella sp. MF05960]|uniref:TonB-dependent receptor n=1 Tax=Shewanella sp. MF05960 TaxID=3434874 RepID=UPI003D79D3C1